MKIMSRVFNFLFIFFKIVSSFTLNGTLETLLWPQLRTDVANRLINSNLVPATNRFTAVEESYRQIYSSIPETGNCWCHRDKRLAPKGPVQDKFDEACKSFHDCLTAGYLSGLSGFDVEMQIYLDVFSETFHAVNDPRLLKLFNYTETQPFNYNSNTSMLTVYDWICDDSLNSPAGQALCLCWEQMEEEFVMTAAMENSNPHSFHESCVTNVQNLYEPVIPINAQF